MKPVEWSKLVAVITLSWTAAMLICGSIWLCVRESGNASNSGVTNRYWAIAKGPYAPTNQVDWMWELTIDGTNDNILRITNAYGLYIKGIQPDGHHVGLIYGPGHTNTLWIHMEKQSNDNHQWFTPPRP